MLAEPALEAAAAAAAALLGEPPDAVEQVRRGAGRNSAVFRVRLACAVYALKQYPPRRPCERDRAAAEMAALRLMADNGMTTAPQPVAADTERGFALIEWIDGAAVTNPDAVDIKAAAAFLAALHALRSAAGASGQPEAAEACLSGREIINQIERRLARLDELKAAEPALTAFLHDVARPLAAEIGRWVQRAYAAHGLSFEHPIAPVARTLCPSDFGFHNALRRPSGALVFIDFEYFGWDDPVKLVADFLLHPGMRLSEALRTQFAAAALDIYGDDAMFAARLALLYPLFAVRWCMILLNEFLPERWAHRINAGGAADWATAKQRQLDRAREWAHSLANNYRWFPYGK